MCLRQIVHVSGSNQVAVIVSLSYFALNTCLCFPAPLSSLLDSWERQSVLGSCPNLVLQTTFSELLTSVGYSPSYDLSTFTKQLVPPLKIPPDQRVKCCCLEQICLFVCIFGFFTSVFMFNYSYNVSTCGDSMMV